MNKNNYTYSFKTSESTHSVFELLLNVEKWWSGLFDETIKGKSRQLNDEFTFKAGDGAHYSKQKLVELEADKKLVWLVTESDLTFLKEPHEWNNSKIRFDLSTNGNETTVTFTHEGLSPQIECYDACSGAWTGYMKNLEKKLN